MTRHRLFIEPKGETVISNPGKNYGIQPAPQPRWVGFVTSWEPRVRFGKHLPVPWQQEYRCRADTAEAARCVLGRLALRDGYALGGVHDITLLEG